MKTYSLEAELRAISTVCDADDEVRGQAQGLIDDHFATPETQEIWGRLQGLARLGKAIPRYTTLGQDPALSDEAREILTTEVQCCADGEDFAALREQLERFRQVRVLYRGVRDVAEGFRDVDAESIDRALTSLEQVIISARSLDDSVRVLDVEAAQDTVDDVLSQRKLDRVPTGFRRFDDAAGGFSRQDLVLIASTTGGGKSVMANQMAINAYLKGHRVAIVSFEMSESEIYTRILSAISEVPHEDIHMKRLQPAQIERIRDYWRRFQQHGDRTGGRFSILCPTIDMTPQAIGQILRPGGFDMVLIDYVGLVAGERNKDLWENLGTITAGFKNLARAQNSVYCAFAQLDEDTNKVKYSKAMRHHSSNVWRWNYGEEEAETGNVTIHQDKARHCRTFSFELIANFATMQFTDPEGWATVRQQLDGETSEPTRHMKVRPQLREIQDPVSAALQDIPRVDDLDL